MLLVGYLKSQRFTPVLSPGPSFRFIPIADLHVNVKLKTLRSDDSINFIDETKARLIIYLITVYQLYNLLRTTGFVSIIPTPYCRYLYDNDKLKALRSVQYIKIKTPQ